MDRYHYVRAMVGASLTLLVISLPLGFVLSSLGWWPQLPA